MKTLTITAQNIYADDLTGISRYIVSLSISSEYMIMYNILYYLIDGYIVSRFKVCLNDNTTVNK